MLDIDPYVSTFLFLFYLLEMIRFTRRVSFINVVIVCILFTYHFPQNKHKIDTSRRPLKKSERSGVSRSMSSSGRTLRGSTSMRCVEGKVNLLTQKLSSTPRSNERARRGDRDFTSNGVEYNVLCEHRVSYLKYVVSSTASFREQCDLNVPRAASRGAPYQRRWRGCKAGGAGGEPRCSTRP